MAGTSIRLAAFLLFALVVGGGVIAAYGAIAPGALAPRGLALEVANPEFAVAPGGEAAVGVAVRNSGEIDETVRLLVSPAGGLEAGDAATVSVGARNATGGFVLVRAPADAAPGTFTLNVIAETVTEPVRRTSTTIEVTVLGDAPAVAAGMGAVVKYVGRLAEGPLFDTNVQAYDALAFPRTSYYRSTTQNATIFTDPDANLITGFRDGVVGMREGETRTLVLAPEDAYGPAELTTDVARRTTVDREDVLPRREVNQPFAEFETLVAGQGKPADAYRVNDTFTTQIDGNTLRFRILEVANGTVRYVLDLEMGARVTIPSKSWWPDASEVVAMNETSIVFRTTPGTAIGEPFTFFDYWPDASAVVDVGEDTITIEHSPAVGFEYERATRQGQAPTPYRVVAVEGDHIEVAYPSAHPLAGKTVVFDVTILEVLPARG